MAGLLLLALLAGCGGHYVAPPPATASTHADPLGAQRALDALTAAVRKGGTAGLDGMAASVAGNAARLQVRGFTARYITEEGGVAADGSWAADVDVAWRFAGFDRADASETVTATFAPSGSAADGDGAVTIRSFGGGDHRVPLWLTGPVSVVRTADTLVLAAGTEQEAARYDRLATTAVATVRRVLPWPHPRLVLEVPASTSALETELDAEPDSYTGVAAVTASVDGSARASAPVHIFVNPEAIGRLTGQGAQVVLSHEATHAATGVAIGSPLPKWLLEGFADYVALRDVKLPLSTTAAQILGDVRRNGPPQHLPDAADFNAQAEDFGEEYESAWLACRVLADRGGEQALVRLYDRVNAGAPLGATMRDVFGFGVATFTKLWQERLSHWAA